MITYGDEGEPAFCCPGRSNAEWIPFGSYINNCHYEYASFAYSRREAETILLR